MVVHAVQYEFLLMFGQQDDSDEFSTLDDEHIGEFEVDVL